MKKWFCAVMACICLTALCACSGGEQEEANQWDCTVACAEESDDAHYIITYSDETVVSSTGVLTFQNRNDFAVVVHLLTDGQKERKAEIAPGGVSTWYEVTKDAEYTVGCHADVEAETEIRLMVYDGARAEVYAD